jgi:hypothetical protein
MILVLLCSSGCATRFGAESIKRLDYYENSLTYEASGRLEPWEQAEEKALDVMLQACPDGEPKFRGGQVISQGVLGPHWYVTFTCNHPVEEF